MTQPEIRTNGTTRSTIPSLRSNSTGSGLPSLVSGDGRSAGVPEGRAEERRQKGKNEVMMRVIQAAVCWGKTIKIAE